MEFEYLKDTQRRLYASLRCLSNGDGDTDDAKRLLESCDDLFGKLYEIQNQLSQLSNSDKRKLQSLITNATSIRKILNQYIVRGGNLRPRNIAPEEEQEEEQQEEQKKEEEEEEQNSIIQQEEDAENNDTTIEKDAPSLSDVVVAPFDFDVDFDTDIDIPNVQWSDLESAFANRIQTGLITNFHHLDVSTFMPDAKHIFTSKIVSILEEFDAVKVYVVLAVEFSIVRDDVEVIELKYFNTKSEPIFATTDLSTWFDTNVHEPIAREIECFESNGSGWQQRTIVHLEVNINKLNQIRGGAQFPLPLSIKNLQACINVDNINDNMCFKWAILSALHPVVKHANRLSKYRQFENELNFDGIEFPVKLTDIPKFEAQNSVSINLYGLKLIAGKYTTITLHLSKKIQKHRHVNLLLLQDKYIDESIDSSVRLHKYHYVWIKYISKLLYSQVSKKKTKKWICDKCMHYYSSEELLKKHQQRNCGILYEPEVTLPDEDHKTIKFKNFIHKERAPLIVYADFESILQPNNDNSRIIQKHVPLSVGFYVNSSFNEKYSKYKSYRQKDVEDITPQKWFIQELNIISKMFEALIKQNKKLRKLTDQEELLFLRATKCHICEKSFDLDTDCRVRDHCHVSGRFRGAAHKSCNLNYSDSMTIPVVFHNLSGYDSHLFITELVSSTVMKGPVSLIPLNKEKYISFTKEVEYVDEKRKKVSSSPIRFKFIDSFKFMASSLDTLSSYITDKRIIDKVFSSEYTREQMNLLKKKGVYPYEYTSSFNTLQETQLPPKEKFHSILMDSDISDEEYNHAVNMWNVFQIKNLGEYSDLYLKVDVILLAEVFENFRDKCLEAYKLDPAYYYTTPGLSWDAMLKASTDLKLELLTDQKMFEFVEAGIRGGISQASNRHSKANNKYMSDYDEKKEIKYIMYYDINNMYGHSMTQYLPERDFKWVEQDVCENNATFFNVPDNSTVGYILEVDLEYPPSLHEKHKDLPMCAEHKCPPGSKQKKLLTTLYDKDHYVIHYRALKYVLKHGLILKKVHRAVEFKQRDWLRDYIEKNNFMRTNAKNEFEKHLFKLFNNSIYGKCMENVRNRRDVKIVSSWEGRYGAEMLISKPNFHSYKIFNENCVAIELTKETISLSKPIFVGLTVLDLSKLLLYSFYYDYMMPAVNQKNLKLIYTDTDSIICEIKNIDIYEIMKRDAAKQFDTSDYAEDNRYQIPRVNKKVLGLMKDECNGNIMQEVVAIRSKLYSARIEGLQTIKKAKGTKSAVVKNRIDFEDYLTCLFRNKFITREQYNIRSCMHVLQTEKQTKIAMNPMDDKRQLIAGTTDTLPWGYRGLDNVAASAKENNEPPRKRCRLDN